MGFSIVLPPLPEVAGLTGCVLTKKYILNPGGIIQIDSRVSLLIITSEGGTYTGSTILNIGYGVAEDQIRVLSNTSVTVGVGSGHLLCVRRESQWGDITITNEDTIPHSFSITIVTCK